MPSGQRAGAPANAFTATLSGTNLFLHLKVAMYHFESSVWSQTWCKGFSKQAAALPAHDKVFVRGSCTFVQTFKMCLHFSFSVFLAFGVLDNFTFIQTKWFRQPWRKWEKAESLWAQEENMHKDGFAAVCFTVPTLAFQCRTAVRWIPQLSPHVVYQFRWHST